MEKNSADIKESNDDLDEDEEEIKFENNKEEK